jgi:hypothetical protein
VRRSAGLIAAVWLVGSSPAGAALTEAQRLAAVYDTILQARFGEVEAQLQQTCPPAPAEACHALRVVAAWWEILINPDSRALDDRLNELAARSIAASAAWTRREPERAEAWFYLAASYGPLVQWRVLRGERLAAAREGKKIKEALERALELDPNLHDAYFGIGLYHYYADIAPPAVKILRFVLLLPGGDRVRGLEEMLQAQHRGEVLKGEASFQLQQIYLWYEKQPAEALRILQDLDGRYARNPLFLRRIAEVHDEHFDDDPSSAAAWETLVARAQAGQVHDAARTEVRARLGLAKALDAMFETDRAVDELRRVLAAPADAVPQGARSRAQLMLGAAYDRLGQRDLAVRQYAAAMTGAPSAVREQAAAALRRRPDASAGEAYRLSLDGWRAFERGAIDDAADALRRAITRAPADPVARYRHARALEAHGEVARAREELDGVLATPRLPAVIRSAALVAYGRMLEGSDPARALALYDHAVNIRGGDLRARDEAHRAIRRLQHATTKQNF